VGNLAYARESEDNDPTFLSSGTLRGGSRPDERALPLFFQSLALTKSA